MSSKLRKNSCILGHPTNLRSCIHNPGEGAVHFPKISNRYVLPVRADFSTQNLLKAVMDFISNKVETGLKARISDFCTVKMGC